MAIIKQIKEYIPLTKIDYDPNENVQDHSKFYAYKQFQTLYNPNISSEENLKYYGKLFPLFVRGLNDIGEIDGIEPGFWYRCGQGTALGYFNDDGSPIYDDNSEIKLAGVDSKLGNLSFRPGHHLSSAPVSRHIGVGASKELMWDANGNPIMTKGKFPKQKTDYGACYSQNVWALVEYSSKADVTIEQLVPCKNKSKFKNTGIRSFCENQKYWDTYYHFRTNSNSDKAEDWIIASAIKVIRVLSDNEVKKIAEERGLKAQYRWKPDGSDNNKFLADFSQFKEKDIQT